MDRARREDDAGASLPPASGAVARRALIVGFAVTGEAVARQLRARGTEVVIVEDHPSIASRSRADSLGLVQIERPDVAALEALLDEIDLVLPSPGVPAHHPVFAAAAARSLRVWSEFELASRWSSIPIVAITGTNGKTTVTTLVTDMLLASGCRTVAAGNNDLPLVDAIGTDVEVIVVEASSFRLQFTETFRPAVAVWLNLAEDHLDWHPSLAAYSAAKARIWACQRDDDLAVVNADDALVMAAAASAPARVTTFGLGVADYRLDRRRGLLVGPDGADLATVADLPRSLPHDLANDLAASAAALAAGADIDACRSVVGSFSGLPHRVTLVREAGGVRYYDDSKATTPASVLAAVRGFDSVVLIAGGRNKGLDLSTLADSAPPVHTVVAIGEASGEIAAAFSGSVPVVAAPNMADAVGLARAHARPGDAVLLSPGCASFDWYRSYAERGDDFVRAVAGVVGDSR